MLGRQTLNGPAWCRYLNPSKRILLVYHSTHFYDSERYFLKVLLDKGEIIGLPST